MSELFKELHRHGVEMEVKPNYIMNSIVINFWKDSRLYSTAIPMWELDTVIIPKIIEDLIIKKLHDFLREIREGR